MDMQTAGPGSQDCITGLKLWIITTYQNSSTTRHVSTTCDVEVSGHLSTCIHGKVLSGGRRRPDQIQGGVRNARQGRDMIR